MTKNKYAIRSKISEAKFREILKYFAADLTAKQIAILTKISRPTINKIFQKILEKIAEFCEKKSEKFFDEIEGDESYFPPKKSGRGAAKKISVVD
jgi:transposase